MGSEFFNRAEILKILQGFNPWWAGGSLEVPSFHRLAFQSCRKLLKNTSIKRAILLSGPRRVGKTTVLLQTAESLLSDPDHPPKGILYLSLDHPLLKLVTLPKILDLYNENIYPVGKPAVLLLDEVQYSEDWELQIKQLIDHRPEYRILATGSASTVMRGRLAESGVGRWVTVPMPTLSFYEFLHIRKEALPDVPGDLRPIDLFKASPGTFLDLAVKFRPLLPLFLRYLLVGGFPETAQQTDASLCQRLLREDVVERVLKRDMTMLFGVRNVADLEKLFIYLCLNTGGLFSVNGCASALGTTAVTVMNHLDVLERANLIYRLNPTGMGGKQVLKARQKVYLVDAALRNAVLLRGEDVLTNSEEMGPIVETTVLRHLYAYYYQDTPTISYWHEISPGKKLEVDIIVKSPRYTIPVEIKYRTDAALSPKEGIAEFCRREIIPKAYWITKSDEDLGVQKLDDVGTSFLKVPAHIFTYLLGQAERLLWEA